jgi:hypothetical protein
MNNHQDTTDNTVVLNGTAIELEEKSFDELNAVVLDLVLNCDDFYTQLVTDDFVWNIRENEEHLEILYAEKFQIKIGNKEKLWIDRIFIPLDGKFQSNEEVTFFFGDQEYSGQPYIHSSGYGDLNQLIQNYK